MKVAISKTIVDLLEKIVPREGSFDPLVPHLLHRLAKSDSEVHWSELSTDLIEDRAGQLDGIRDQLVDDGVLFHDPVTDTVNFVDDTFREFIRTKENGTSGANYVAAWGTLPKPTPAPNL